MAPSEPPRTASLGLFALGEETLEKQQLWVTFGVFVNSVLF